MLGVTGQAAGFSRALFLAIKPSLVRLRFDPAPFDMPSAITEAEFRLEELLALGAALPDLGDRIGDALVVENGISSLSVSVLFGGVVWSTGYDTDVPTSLGWMQAAGARERVRLTCTASRFSTVCAYDGRTRDPCSWIVTRCSRTASAGAQACAHERGVPPSH